MNNRTRTIASFFSVAMGAMLLGAAVTSQIQKPAEARFAETSPKSEVTTRGTGGVMTLDTFREIAKDKTPGVVNINTKKIVKRSRLRDPFREFFGDDMMDRFFGGPQGQDRQTQRSLGSGFVIDKAGYILTNRHVVDGADEISVTFPNGKTYDRAKLVGNDARTDVALLKIEPKEALTLVDLGDSDQTEVGEWVMAIGNPFGLGGNSVTVGVVSFKGRSLQLTAGTGVDMIQTDASINPGNSGGPLLNTRGQVIGINTLIITQGVAQSSGVGFAVPINVAKEILPQLREKGKVVRGWLGVTIEPVSEDMAKTFGMKEAKGAVVSSVTQGSPADKAGIKAEDVVLGVDGKRVESNGDLSRYIASKAPQSTVRLQVLRDGAEKPVSVTLGTFPEETETANNDSGQKGKLGMRLQELTPALAERLELPRGTRGIVIVEVEAGEPAETAGLQARDVILSVNGKAVGTVEEFEAEVSRAQKDGLARLRVRRGTQQFILTLRLS